jgi:hypothetical protein
VQRRHFSWNVLTSLWGKGDFWAVTRRAATGQKSVNEPFSRRFV